MKLTEMLMFPWLPVFVFWTTQVTRLCVHSEIANNLLTGKRVAIKSKLNPFGYILGDWTVTNLVVFLTLLVRCIDPSYPMTQYQRDVFVVYAVFTIAFLIFTMGIVGTEHRIRWKIIIANYSISAALFFVLTVLGEECPLKVVAIELPYPIWIAIIYSLGWTIVMMAWWIKYG